jgi:hypothetical protein
LKPATTTPTPFGAPALTVPNPFAAGAGSQSEDGASTADISGRKIAKARPKK